MEGIDDAIWWSIVTVTTVGYGDRVAITAPGRLVSILWMTIGVVCFSILSGAMASEFSAALDTSSREYAISHPTPLRFRSWRLALRVPEPTRFHLEACSPVSHSHIPLVLCIWHLMCTG